MITHITDQPASEIEVSSAVTRGDLIVPTAKQAPDAEADGLIHMSRRLGLVRDPSGAIWPVSVSRHAKP
jgi:hypothetical protein